MVPVPNKGERSFMAGAVRFHVTRHGPAFMVRARDGRTVLAASYQPNGEALGHAKAPKLERAFYEAASALRGEDLDTTPLNETELAAVAHAVAEVGSRIGWGAHARRHVTRTRGAVRVSVTHCGRINSGEYSAEITMHAGLVFCARGAVDEPAAEIVERSSPQHERAVFNALSPAVSSGHCV
jgi:hypothetical protein